MNEPGGFVKMFKCGIDCCKYESDRASKIRRHQANIHDVGIIWHKCDQDGCNFKCKSASHLKRHKANIHDIGVTWHKCDQDGCDYKCKQASVLKQHKANIHDIEVKWYKCDQDECNYKCKSAGDLKRHCEFVHDIGKNQCEYCFNNRNSKNSYLCKITGITSNICNGCYNKVTVKNTRKEKEWSDYLDKHLGINGLLSSDKNLRQLGGCQLYRPDKLYTDLNYVEVGECDEFEHKHSNGNYDCDERRISEIYEEDGIIGKNLAVLRWNPDNYTPKEGLKKLSRKERLKVYVELSKKLREKTSHTDKIHIYYLFYSEDNPRLSKNIPYTMIHNLDEISHI